MIESHAQLNHAGQGRRGLGHITRSGLFMLCAAWELYLEELTVELAAYLADRALEPENLPLSVQRELAKHVKEHKNELKPLEMAGAGWEHVYLSHVRESVSALHTPKAGPINQMYRKLVGWEETSASWSLGTDFINGFVKIRGDIAHRGSDADYVRIGVLREYRDGIYDTVIEHDNAANDYVREVSVGGRPWRRRVDR